MRDSSIFWKALLVFLVSLQAWGEGTAQRRSLELELEAVSDSSGYEVEVIRVLPEGKRGSPKLFELKTATWKATLAPGHYEMRARSIDSRGVAGEWNPPRDFMVNLFAPKLIEPADLKIVTSSDSKKEKIKFQWVSSEKASLYHLEVKNQKNEVAFKYDTTETFVSVELPVAVDYSWQVTPSNKEMDTAGESSPTQRFKVIGAKLDEPDILKPSELETKILNWKPVEFADKYEILLEQKTEEGWKKSRTWLETAPFIKFSTALPTGTYRLMVKATAYDRLDSDESHFIFETENTESEDSQRASYQMRKRFFLQLGLAPGFFSYTNNSLDLDTNSTVSAYGATGALTFGTWFKPRSSWGLMATLETQAIPLSGQFSTYSSLTLNGIKKFDLGNSSQLKVYLGLQKADVPNVGVDVYGNVQQSKIGILSPVLKLAFYHGLTSNLGYNFYGQLAESVTGNTSTNSSVSNQPTEQFGLGLSKRLRQNLIGGIDYYYRIENANYYHYPTTGFPNIPSGVNQVSLTSHNMMFSLQLGF